MKQVANEFTTILLRGEDVSFADFVIKCAGKHGVIPVDQTSHIANLQKLLEQAEAEVARIKQWDEARAEREAQQTYDFNQRVYEEELARTAEYIRRLIEKRNDSLAWDAPTEFRDFRRDLIDSLNNETDRVQESSQPDAPQRYTGAQFKQMMLHAARTSVSVYWKDLEIARQSYDPEAMQVLLESLQQTSSEAAA